MGAPRRSPPRAAPAAHPPVPPTHNARYEVPSAVQQVLGLWVRAVGFHTAQVAHGLRNRVLGNHAAVYVSRGSGWFESPPTGRLAIKPGTLYWLFPTVPHSYSPNAGATWAEQWVIFGGSMADAFESLGMLSPAKPFVEVGDDAEVVRIFSRLEDVFLEGGPLAVPLAAALTHQLIVVAHGLATGLSGASGKADPVVAMALRIIEQEALHGLLPEELARRLHVGYSTLRRRFKGQTGYAVKEYILRVRLKFAKDLLAFSGRTIEQVAADSGFEDAFYFSRLFREREGMPPKLFRAHQERKP